MVSTRQNVNFAKCNVDIHKIKKFFLRDGITTAHSHNKFNVNDDNDRAILLKHFYKFSFNGFNAISDITECFIFLFAKQPDKALLD